MSVPREYALEKKPPTVPGIVGCKSDLSSLIKTSPKPRGENVRSNVGYAVKTLLKPCEKNKKKMILHIMVIASVNSI